jgi:nitroimidazol reductase NimA-like FMN-containing flavoprotein (pyridoxamine 5'-phosphate oxidase superfamily)
MTPSDSSFIRELSVDDCYTLLGETTTVGRLAFVAESGGQQLLPVNFVVVERVVYVRTADDSIIATLAEGHDDVAFGVDHHDDVMGTGWSVTATGSTRRVDEVPADPASVDSGRPPHTPRPWAPGDRDVLIALTPQRITGRRVRRG